MTLMSNAAMVLFYDIEGNVTDHDDWHSNEHFHERLSVPGFLRATRWVAENASPRYLITYEVSGIDVATSSGYLDRLNDPTPWTRAMMPRFRGMVRGFCHVAASFGLGLGSSALAIRYRPEEGAEERLSEWLSGSVLPEVAAVYGIASVHIFQPTAQPPMTREQALRGPDSPMPWLVLITAFETDGLDRAATDILNPAFQERREAGEVIIGRYRLSHSATAEEVRFT